MNPIESKQVNKVAIMNIMARAHSLTRVYFRNVKDVTRTYADVFSNSLRFAHKQFKEECKNSPIQWYAVEGHVVCPDTDELIPVYEGSSKATTAAASLLWYVENFDKHCLKVVASRENGSVFVEKPNTNYK